MTDGAALRFPSETCEAVSEHVANAREVRTAGDLLTSRTAGGSSAGGKSAGNFAECIASGDNTDACGHGASTSFSDGSTTLFEEQYTAGNGSGIFCRHARI